MFIYAQLNSNGICVSISQLADEVDMPNLIPLTEEELSNADFLGRPYIDGEWGARQPEPEAPPAPVSTDELMEMQLAQMGAIADVYEQQQEDTLIMFEAMATLFEAITGEV